MSMTAITRLSSQQAHATKKTISEAKHFLKYMSTWQDVKIKFHASDMILVGDVDASLIGIWW